MNGESKRVGNREQDMIGKDIGAEILRKLGMRLNKNTPVPLLI